MRDLLVTGTDTGVGKTVIAAALVAALRARGVQAVGFKPVETGVDGTTPADSEILASVSEKGTGTFSEKARKRFPSPFPLLQLREPLAPAVAADRAGVVLNPEDIERRVRDLRAAGYALVIEGAGGVMVPLTWDYTALDLAERCDLDAVVVGRAGLGTLNHIMLTVLMLQSRQIPVRGIVLNGRRPSPDLAEATNPSALAKLLPGLRIVEVPHQDVGELLSAATTIVDRLL